MERDYPGSVESVALNAEFVAVLCEGRVFLQTLSEEHTLPSPQVEGEEGRSQERWRGGEGCSVKEASLVNP